MYLKQLNIITIDKIKILFNINKINIDEIVGLDSYNLDKLFVYFNTDKGSEVKIINKIQKGHNYSSHYEKYLSKFKNKDVINPFFTLNL